MRAIDPKKSGQNVTDGELKQVLLEIMDSIHRFCQENHIRYYLLGGTMLGAVRHKGFIPWDDDIDIGIPREDYERFCRIYADEENGYELKCIHNDPTYYLPFAKVIDPRISLYEQVHKAPQIGVYVDVFPLDNVQEDGSGFFNGSIGKTLEDLRYMQVRKDRAVWKNALILASRLVYPRSLHQIACAREDRANAVSCPEDTQWIANLHGAWGKREIVPSAYFGEGATYVFEGRSYQGPVNYDGYLTSLYRDYMTPPPPEKRITHHSFTARWK